MILGFLVRDEESEAGGAEQVLKRKLMIEMIKSSCFITMESKVLYQYWIASKGSKSKAFHRVEKSVLIRFM